MFHVNDLAKTMEDLLNNNDYGQTFRVFPYIQILDRTFEKIDDEYTPFITVMMTNTTGKYRPVQGVLINDSEFNLEAYFEYEKKDLVYDCFQNLARQIVGNMVSVVSDNVTYSIPMTMDIPNIGNLQVQHIEELRTNNPRLGFMNRSKFYCVLQVRLYYSYSEDVLFGNQVKIYLKKKDDEDYEELVYVGNTIGNARVTREEQILNQATSSAVVTTNSFTSQIVTYYKPDTILDDIVKDIIDGSNQNAVYTLKIEFPNFSKELDVVLVNPSLPIVRGNTLQMTLNFAKANGVLMNGD